jgi:hypothetical protein
LDPTIASAIRHKPRATRPIAMTHMISAPPVWRASVASAPDWSALPPNPNAILAMM